MQFFEFATYSESAALAVLFGLHVWVEGDRVELLENVVVVWLKDKNLVSSSDGDSSVSNLGPGKELEISIFPRGERSRRVIGQEQHFGLARVLHFEFGANRGMRRTFLC